MYTNATKTISTLLFFCVIRKKTMWLVCVWLHKKAKYKKDKLDYICVIECVCARASRILSASATKTIQKCVSFDAILGLIIDCCVLIGEMLNSCQIWWMKNDDTSTDSRNLAADTTIVHIFHFRFVLSFLFSIIFVIFIFFLILGSRYSMLVSMCVCVRTCVRNKGHRPCQSYNRCRIVKMYIQSTQSTINIDILLREILIVKQLNAWIKEGRNKKSPFI